ncbi:hypothetical protein C8J57DRAFT_1230927 [Mycena rebaudengoi]|nr:hypothetical protein C8J57DRAFT_1230927 [Mycena rebaudengoi]
MIGSYPWTPLTARPNFFFIAIIGSGLAVSSTVRENAARVRLPAVEWTPVAILLSTSALEISRMYPGSKKIYSSGVARFHLFASELPVPSFPAPGFDFLKFKLPP